MENLGTYDSGVSFRKFIFFFLLISLILGIGVSYFTLSKANIRIIPKSAVREVSLNVVIDGNSTAPDLEKGFLPGEIKIREADGGQTNIEVSAKKIEELAKGKVIIHNNTPYVQGIRQGAILHPTDAPPEVLFTTLNRVLLPPKSSREVDIIASIKGAKGNLPPGKFEFLNLDNKYMHDNIYADNKEKIEGGIREANIITQEDLDRANSELANRMFKKTLEEMNKNLNEDQTIKEDSAHYTVLDKKSSSPVGSEIDKFDINLKIEVQGTVINQKDLRTIAEKRIQTMGEANEEFIRYEPDSFTYSLSELDLINKKATFKVSLKGLFVSKLSSKVFDKEGIIGYNQRALEEHFHHFDNVDRIEVDFWPSFRKTVPNTESRIDISIKPL